MTSVIPLLLACSLSVMLNGSQYQPIRIDRIGRPHTPSQSCFTISSASFHSGSVVFLSMPFTRPVILDVEDI